MPDTAHVAVAAHNNVDYLVTWNQAHIRNDDKLEEVRDILEELGLKRIKIVSPSHWRDTEHEEN